MSELQDIMAELERLGSEQCRKIYRNHGAPEAMFGVKVGDMKKVARKIKGDQQLALDLFATGNGDAQYLAGMIAQPQAFTREQLDCWADTATWYMVSEYAVPGVTAESPHAWACGLSWIASETDKVSSAGWATLAANVSIHDDDAMDFARIEQLVRHTQEQIHRANNRTRYTMNQFIISVGAYIPALNELALQAASAIGKVEVDLGTTACKVPDAVASIQKIMQLGRVGKKRKTARC